MCGIAGYYGPTEIPAERIRAALALMRRRGPDAEGHWHHACASGRHVHLLFARLAIIDLDPRSNQPFAVDGGMLSYNGELYNYLELRAAMERAGTKLRTTSDTEVLAQVLAQSGPQGLAALRGHVGARLVRSRDRAADAGARPLRRKAGLCLPRRRQALFRLRGQVPVRPDGPAPAGQRGAPQALSRQRLQGALQDARRLLPRPGERASRLLARRRRDRTRRRNGRTGSRRFPATPADMSYEEAVAGTRSG